MEGFVAILIFVIVTAFIALVLGVWLLLACARLFFKAIDALLSPSRQAPKQIGVGLRHATDCDAVNSRSAAFCRRCGRRLTAGRVPPALRDARVSIPPALVADKRIYRPVHL